MFSAVLQNTAVIAAIVAAVTWVLNKIQTYVVTKRRERHDRRIALIRFQADIRLRREGLQGLDSPSYVTGTIAMIERHANEGRTFRIYGAQVTDTLSQDRVDEYLDVFDVETIHLVKKVVILDRLMIAEYENMQTPAFEQLEVGRKIAAFRKWVEVAGDLKTAIDTLIPELQVLPKSIRLPS